VLLVEDNPGDAELLRLLLAESGVPWRVEEAARLDAALDRLARDVFDAVILDLGLPDAHGTVVIERVRAAVPDLPIIVLTGSSPESGPRALAVGAEEYLVKGQADGRSLERAVVFSIERHRRARLAEALASERAARQRQSELDALFASMLDPVLVYDASHHVRDANRAAIEFLGFDPRGLTSSQFIARARLADADGRSLRESGLPAHRAMTGESVAGERLRMRVAAGERHVSVSASALREEDAVRGAVVVYRDITQRVEAEREIREGNERVAQLNRDLERRAAELEAERSRWKGVV